MAEKYVLGPNAARAVKQLVRGTGSVSSRVSFGSPVVYENDFPAPWTVKWSETQRLWMMWMPASIVNIDGEEIDADDIGIGDVGGSYPSGWKNISFLSSDGGTVYLKVWLTDYGYKADLTDTNSGFPSGAKACVYIPICIASYDSTTGERRVKQLATSCITVNLRKVVYMRGDQGSKTMISNLVEISGMSTANTATTSCGITFTSVKVSGNNFSRIYADLKNRDSNETDWGVHSLNYTGQSGQTYTVHFLGAEDVTIPAASGGGTSITADETFNVITGLQYDSTTGWIQIKTREATVANGIVTAFGSESAWTNAIETTPHSNV